MGCAVVGVRSGKAFLRRRHFSGDLNEVREGAVMIPGEKGFQREG